MPKKTAFLIGCNYPGTNAALNGCINDVWGQKEMLKTYFGFDDSEITVMIDTDKTTTQPTGRNIKNKLKEIVAAAEDDDIIFLHFSGHGTQVPSDGDDEADAKDEAICPTDMNIICDDDLRIIFTPLSQKKNVKFTFVADCCHSGTILDHEAVQITGPKEGGPAPPAVDAQAIQNMLASLGAKREMKNRSLPTNDLISMLSSILGKPVEKGGLRTGMADAFGDDASAKSIDYAKYAQMAMEALAKMNAGGASGGTTEKRGDDPMGMIIGLLKSCMGGATSATAGGATAAAFDTTAPPPVGKKPDNLLAPDVGILITGCQDKETSADACPSGDPNKAHGALSNAMQTVVKTHYTQHPDVPLSNRNLVLAVRQTLAQTKFSQNPCLECSDHWTDTPFVVHGK